MKKLFLLLFLLCPIAEATLVLTPSDVDQMLHPRIPCKIDFSKPFHLNPVAVFSEATPVESALRGRLMVATHSITNDRVFCGLRGRTMEPEYTKTFHEAVQKHEKKAFLPTSPFGGPMIIEFEWFDEELSPTDEPMSEKPPTRGGTIHE